MNSFSLTSRSIGISRIVRWIDGVVDWTICGESGFSIIVMRGLRGLRGEVGDLGVTGGGDSGISIIGLGVFRGGTV